MARQHELLEVELGNAIRAQRIEHRLTQDELANARTSRSGR